jgi:threonine/homoserine/homoserine lactone efflux protein
MNLLMFLLTVVGISLSGVMAPGPVTAATLTAGSRSRHAGALIALGHGVVELPLMLLIMAGLGKMLASEAMKIGIGLTGGMFLLLMGGQMLRSLKKGDDPGSKYAHKKPLYIGILLTAGNPYFLLWWATTGMALAARSWELGVLAFALFALIHWLCDFFWLEALSWASFNGSKLISEKNQRIVLLVCALALVFFGCMFIWDAADNLL